ncbi:Cullin-associated NEDD8-dissociated protein 1 [Gonapodya sp. JEL0774]|nr:Cullin-associated NEDD8-dissociated protein 1 [Gonapodya sp. JEL0774]
MVATLLDKVRGDRELAVRSIQLMVFEGEERLLQAASDEMDDKNWEADDNHRYIIDACQPEMSSSDSDFRYMAATDMAAALSQPNFVLDDSNERKVVQAILKLIEDVNGEVQNVAVKCLAPLVKKSRDSSISDISDRLCDLLVQKTREELRDIASIGLKTVIAEIPLASESTTIPGTSSSAGVKEKERERREATAVSMARRLAPKFVALLKTGSPEILMDVLDLLSDLLARFGPALQPLLVPIRESLLPLLDHTRPAVRKRAALALGVLVGNEGEKEFADMVTGLVARGADKERKGDWERLRTVVQALGVLSRYSAPKMGAHLDVVVPLVVKYAAMEDDELREICLQTLESLVLRCPSEITPHISSIISLSLEYLKYDPNYAGDEDEDEEGEEEGDTDMDADDEDDGLDDDQDYSDDDDLSWKVRKSASRVLAAIVATRSADATLLREIYTTVAPALVRRFAEREEGVRVDVLSTFLSLVRQTGDVDVGVVLRGSEDGRGNKRRKANGGDRMQTDEQSPRALLGALVPKLSKSVAKQISGKSIPTRQICFQLLKELVRVLHGGLDATFPMFVPSVVSSLSAPSSSTATSSNLKIEVLDFLSTAFSEQPDPNVFSGSLDKLVPAVVECCNDKFYKIVSEALQCATALVSVLRPVEKDGTGVVVAVKAVPQDGVKHLMTLYNMVSVRLSTADADLEVKERALALLGALLSQAGDLFPADQLSSTVIPLLLDRLRNELTRLATVQVVNQVAAGPLAIAGTGLDLKSVLPDIIGEVSALLRKSQRQLRVSSLSCLEELVSRYGRSGGISEASYLQIIAEVKPLMTNTDWHVLPLALSLLASIIYNAPVEVVARNDVVSSLVKLVLENPQLVGSGLGLEAIVQVWTALVRVGGSPVFKDAMGKLMEPVTAGKTVSKPAYQAVATGVATLLLNAPAADRTSTVGTLVSRVEDASQPENVRLLALLTLGEVGRQIDLSQTNPNLHVTILGLFSHPSEETKSAAAFAAGNIAVGNLSKYVPILVDAIKQTGKTKYLALVALKETITRYTMQNLAARSSSVITAGRSGNQVSAQNPPGLSVSSLRAFPHAEQLWPLLFAAAEEATEEGTRNVVAESLGRLSLSSPEKFLPELRARIQADKAATRAAVVTAVRYTFSDHTQHGYYDDQLIPLVPEFMKLVKDHDLNVRRAALATLNSAAHNKPYLIRDSLNEMLPLLYEECNQRPELVRIVEMGPFKHRIDDGLDIRKLAYECMYTLLENLLPRIDLYAFLTRVIKGFSDEAQEVKVLAHLMFQRLGYIAPGMVSQRLDEVADVLKATVETKNKGNAVKQEIEKNAELVKSAIRCTLVTARLSDPGGATARTAPQFYRSPTIVAHSEKRADVKRKLRLASVHTLAHGRALTMTMSRLLRIFDAIQAFHEGKLPTNQQLKSIIDRLQTSRNLENSRYMLSQDGNVVLDDFFRVLRSLKRVIDDKNSDEDIQSFIFHSRMATISAQDARVRSTLYEGSPSVGQAAREGFSAASTIARLLVTNNEFRELLLDFSELFQDVLVGFSEKRRERARSDLQNEDAYGIDRNRAGLRTRDRDNEDRDGYSDREVRGDRRRDREHTYTRDSRYESIYSNEEDLERDPGGFREYSYSFYEPTSIQTDGGEVDVEVPSVGPPFVTSERVRVTTRDDEPRSHLEREDQGRYFSQRQTRDYDDDENSDVRTTGRASSKKDYEAPSNRDALRQSLPEDYRSLVDDAADVIGERLSIDRRRQLVERFRKICEDLSGNEEYHSSIKYLLEMVERLAEVSGKVGRSISSKAAKRARKDANLLAAEYELKSLVEKFANGQSLDPILDQLKEFSRHVAEDFYLRDYLRDLRVFVYRSLEEPSYLSNSDYVRKGSEIINRGRAILFESYKNDTTNLLGVIRDFMHELQSDTVTRDFADDIRRITRDTFLDENGGYTFKPDLIRDFATVILPLLFDQVKYIPISRIEHNDDQYHVIMEDLIITSDNFLPNVLEVKMKNAVVMGLRKSLESSFNSHITLNLYQIFADIRDVPFYFKRKKGFPRMSDHGVLSMLVGGQGISVLLKLGLEKDDPKRTLFVRRIRTHVDDLRIDIRGEKHEALYTMFSPLIHQLVRTQIQKTVDITIRDWVNYIDAQITNLKSNIASGSMGLGDVATARGAMNRFVNSLGLSGGSRRFNKQESEKKHARYIESSMGEEGRRDSPRSTKYSVGR